MFKHYLALDSAGFCKKQQCFITLIGLLMFLLSYQTVSAQEQIAIDTHAIFQQSCNICHGPDGAYKESLLMEHNALIEKGSVVPGNPDASELYNRLITTDTAKRMPLGQPQLPARSINTIRNWILAGAPDWATVTTTDGDFISSAEILNTIETHLMSLASFDRAFARYFTMTHLYNAGESTQILQEYRKALYKLVNSLSWGSAVTNPQPIDPQGTIFYIDLRHYEWDRNDGWTKIEAEYPYHIPFDASEQSALKAQLGRLQTEMKSEIPAIHVDWFVAQASLPPLYHDLLSLPLTDRELETRLEVDVTQNLLNAPGVRVWRAGTNNSGVSANNRVLERHTSRYGAYWKSYDFAGSVGTQNVFTHPLSFTPDGGEVIFNLPNGLQGYYITNASGFRLDDAPINIVSNPAASDPTVRNGLSCFGCHTKGMNTFEDQVRAVIESNTAPTYNKAQALRLYVEKSEMDALVQEDMGRYRVALEATGGMVDDIEPIQRFHEVFQGPVDASYAAAVVGLETEAFLEKIRENIGLQNAGLLVLASPNGSVKRDAWTSSFKDILFALDFPQLVDKPPVVPEPDRLPGAFIHIPDTNLRAAIAEALGKTPNAPITGQEIERLGKLDARNRSIQDLTGLQFATNLNWLHLHNNQVSDLSPLAGLINLHHLDIGGNPFSDISPVVGLINLEVINFPNKNVGDISFLAGFKKLKSFTTWDNPISDLSVLAELPQLETVDICHSGGLPDISLLAGLTNLKALYFVCNKVSDISPLAGLTKLTRLSLRCNKVSDISPLAGLVNLKWLELNENDISDISPLAGLTNLTWLDLSKNKISDLSPLEGVRENLTTFIWYGIPAFPTDAPKIEGPWRWVVLPDTQLKSDTDLLSEASGGAVTEGEIATDGAIEGDAVGSGVWTSHRLPPTGGNNIEDMLKHSLSDGVIYGSVSLYSPREQHTTMYVGGERGVRVWLNGSLIYERLNHEWWTDNYTAFFPVMLKQGRNVLLVAIGTWGAWSNGFFGFESGTDYTVSTGVGYTFSQTPIHTGDTFTFDLRAENIADLAGWQFDIAFDPTALEAINVSEGDFLKQNGASTFFQGGSIDNAAGKITGLNAARLSTQGMNGTGTLLRVRFKAKAARETELALRNFEFAASTGDSIPAGPHEIHITIEGQLATGDVNRDGRVSILDLVLAAQQLGKRVPAGSAVDVNGDGVVSILDLILVSQGIAGSSAAPPNPPPPLSGGEGRVDAATIEAWIAQARLEDDGSLAFKQGIENLEKLLASLIPEKTALLANYPNPFNPETWIPYQLAEAAEVTLTIYDMNGQLIRRLTVGHQGAGMYRSRSRAVYWDGRNQLGEFVASGLYFYTLGAGEFSATRRMLILK
ncbi:T9SS type A sorting domain-containing protein [Candidatus Poribacteria bacterium]|nr:T9SS type A sorting domain-containing protein [Candidatus Poribacteria bacterium]